MECPVFADGEGGPDAAESSKPEFLGFLEELEAIRKEFKPHLWQAFWRTAVEESPAPVVAAELGMTANAVRVAKHRVLERIRSAHGIVAGAAPKLTRAEAVADTSRPRETRKP
jgi:RNA polymerase sigma-70 factor (ECF subfamily)